MLPTYTVTLLIMPTRLELLHQFLQEDSTDPFNHYALAQEYQKTDIAKAISIYEQLLRDHPDYIPTYYHLGKRYVDTNETEKALAIFEKGIGKSMEAGDYKAARELKAAYQELLDDDY